MGKERNSSFDLLRICAAVMVVMLHVSSSYCWYELMPNRVEWMVMNFYDCLTRSAVPLFFMLSGAFMLKKHVALKKLYFKKIIPLTIVYGVWSFLYAIDTIGLDSITKAGIVEIIRVTVNSHYHLWFIPVLIGIYILQPLLHAIVNYKDGEYVRYFLCIFLIFGVLCPTVLLFITSNTIATFITSIPVELMNYSGYVILGHYLANMDNRKYNSGGMLCGFIVTVGIATVICQIDALNRGMPNGLLYGYFSLTSFVEAITLFLWFKNIDLSNYQTFQKILYELSTLTLGIYLLHPFVISQMDSILHINTLSYNTVFSVPGNTIMVVVVCVLVTFVMAKIPFVRRLWKF